MRCDSGTMGGTDPVHLGNAGLAAALDAARSRTVFAAAFASSLAVSSSFFWRIAASIAICGSMVLTTGGWPSPPSVRAKCACLEGFTCISESGTDCQFL